MTASIDELVGVDAADVYVGGHLVATILRQPTAIEFRYRSSVPADLAVATTLPVRKEPTITPGRAVPPYFAGLLPEGRRLTALRSALKTSADDDFSMLLAIGDDPVGNVQVVPAGEPPPEFAPEDPGAAGVENTSFGDLFDRATGESPDRSGLAGVQDKVSGRMISLPVRMRGRSVLLKLDPPEFPHLVANERFFLDMAAACGLRPVNAEVVHDRDGRPGLLIDRFDRDVTDDGTSAFAVEDGCQVIGRYPGDKYALTAEQVVTALAALCRARPVAALGLFRQFAFSLVTGNGDLHAKNVSVVRRDGEWAIAPVYDIPSSYPYGDSTLALRLGGSRDGQVSRKRLLAFAAEVGVRERAAVMALDELLDASEPWLDRLDQLPFDERRLHDLRRFMQARMRLLRGPS